MTSTKIDGVIDKFTEFTNKPVKFLTAQTELKDDIKSLVKSLYDYTKTQEQSDETVKKRALPELIIKDFDEEQIWQEIELHNSECWDQLVWEVASCISSKNDLVFPVTTEEEDILENDKEEVNLENDEGEATFENDEEDSEPDSTVQSDSELDKSGKKSKKSKSPLKSKVKPSMVDDQFFKLQEMEKFLLNEEKTDRKAASDSEESIDMFEDIDDEDSADDEGGKEAMYNDFFSQEAEGNEPTEEHGGNDSEHENYDEDNDEQENEDFIENEQNLDPKLVKTKNEKRVRFTLDEESSDDNSDDTEASKEPNKILPNTKTSEFERRQQRIKQQIEKLEEKTLSEAPWQLKGEVDVTKRPQNSLLEEVVDFDLTTRPPPVITEQTTFTLEDIIKRRIQDKAWDDVEKKEKPVMEQHTFHNKVILDASKSKQSLAQIYEAEYIKQKQASSGEAVEEKEPESHIEIREAMSKLFSKLDALTHYHYTPKPPQAEVKIVSNTPAISMEEVAPVAVSDAALLAPEEVKKKRKGELISKEERTQTDRKRERRKKKRFQRAKGEKQKKYQVNSKS